MRGDILNLDSSGRDDSGRWAVNYGRFRDMLQDLRMRQESDLIFSNVVNPTIRG
jgi:hypothetical protein